MLIRDAEEEGDADQVGDLASKFDSSLRRNVDEVRDAEVLIGGHFEDETLKVTPTAARSRSRSAEAEPLVGNPQASGRP